MIGREQESQRLNDAMSATGVVVQIVGPPGIGKTTLARHAMDRHNGVFVQLDSIVATGFIEAVAQRLDVPASNEAIVGALGELRFIGLDGIEGIRDTVSNYIDQWHAAVPSLNFLVTTQRRLEANVTLELGSLPVDEATTLFRKRAESVSATLDLNAEADAVEELVRRLDGWPLAIELAASRLRLFSPTELLSESPLAVLKDSKRQQRHASLRIVLETCIGLLQEEDRRALFQIAVFRNGFDREAFKVVSGASLESLERLMDASLVRWERTEKGRRYSLLNPVRAYALERGRPGAGSEAYAQFVLARAEEAVEIERSSKASEAIHSLRRWSADLQGLVERKDATAARAAIALSVLAKANGPTLTAIDWVASIPREGLSRQLQRELDLRQATLHIRSDAPPETLALVDWPDNPAVLTIKALLLMCQMQLDSALEAARYAKRFSEERNALDWVVEATFAIGVILLQRGEPAEAARYFDESLDLVSDLDRPNLEGLILKHSALCDRCLGRPSLGQVQKLKRAVALHQSTHAQRLEAMATGILAVVLMDIQDPEAQAVLDRARVQSRRTGELSNARKMWVLAGMKAIESGNIREVRNMLAHQPRQNDPWSMITRKMLEGLLAHFNGLETDALRLLKSSEQEMADLGMREETQFNACMHAILSGSAPPPRDSMASTAGLDVAWRIADCHFHKRPLPSDLVRAARRCLETRVVLQLANRSSGTVVAQDGRWFQHAGGESVDLSRKRVLQRVLAAIVQSEHPIHHTTLLETAWKGERMTADSGRARVHVAISELRKLGLRDVLVTVDTPEGSAYRVNARIVAE